MLMLSPDMQTDCRDADTASSDSTRPKPSWTAACEQFIKRMISNRLVWLIFGCALYINAYLTYIQWSTAKHGAQQFDTLELIAHLLVVTEFATLAVIMLLMGVTGSAVCRWQDTYPHAPFPHFAYACAVQLTAACFMLAQLLLMLYPHSYPQLMEEGISIPLMFSQRALLVFVALCVSANIGWLVRFYTKLPLPLCAFITAAFHVALGYTVTLQSLRFESFVRLNSVFYYNELWRYIPDFPDLRHANLFHNIQMPYFAYYMLGALLIACLPALLWIPRAIIISHRETRTHRTKSLP